MQKNYATSHRPKREDARAKETADLKRENFELKRTVKRLKKELSKRVTAEEEAIEDGLQETNFEININISNDDKCPECSGTAVRRLTLAAKEFLVCPDCKWRTKV